MATDLESHIRIALEKLAKALADAGDVTVETRYKPIDPQNPDSLDSSFLAARTVIKLDGDQDMIVPVTVTETGAIIFEESLLDMHLRNVQSAIEYRRSALNTLVDIFRRRGG